jgi:hypothetical protein
MPQFVIPVQLCSSHPTEALVGIGFRRHPGFGLWMPDYYICHTLVAVAATAIWHELLDSRAKAH